MDPVVVFGVVIGVAIWHIRRKRRQRQAERDEEEGTAVETVQTMVYVDKDGRREKEKVSSGSRPHSRREERNSRRNSGSRPHSHWEEGDRGSRPHSQRASRRESPSDHHGSSQADGRRDDRHQRRTSRRASPSERRAHRTRRDSPTTEDNLEAEKHHRLTYEYAEKEGNVAKKSEELEKLAPAQSPYALPSIPKVRVLCRLKLEGKSNRGLHSFISSLCYIRLV